MLYNNTEFYVADKKKNLYAVDMCNKIQPNDVCSGTFITNGTDIHGTATINMTSTVAENIRNDYKIVCKKAGGQFVLETFSIGLKSDKMNFNNFTTMDVYTIGFPDCVGITTCKNATHVVDFIKYSWEYFLNASVCNFTLYEIIWDNSTTYP
jgi:hypothetical protein